MEGETFTAEIVASVQQTEYRDLIRLFSRDLVKRHQQIQGRGVQRLDSGQPMAYVSTGEDLMVSPPLAGFPAYELYTGCDATLCRSRNNGQSWTPVAGAPRPEKLAANSDGTRFMLYLGTPGALLTSAGMQSTSLLESLPGRGNILGGGIYRITSLLPSHWIYVPMLLRGH